jgi:hypothetical protein
MTGKPLVQKGSIKYLDILIRLLPVASYEFQSSLFENLIVGACPVVALEVEQEGFWIWSSSFPAELLRARPSV